jgi:predicted transcriptional regulator
VENLRKEGMSEAQIAEGCGITTTQLRAAKSIALASQKQEQVLMAQRLKEKGLSNGKIAQRMGLAGESSVRALLAPGAADNADALMTTSKMIKDQVDQKKYVDIGEGNASQLGITESRFKTAVAVLQEQGYPVHNIQNLQLGTGKYTTRKVLAIPGTTLSEVQRNRSQIQLINDYSEDYGRSFLKVQDPIQVSSRRIAINYAEDGGGKADGVIYIRPGVKDLSLGGKNYGQVRIAVDGTHYLKGMALYKDDLPKGTDIVFNTNKSNTGRKKDAMKELSSDPILPFGSIVRQVHGPDGKVISALNIVGSPTKEGSGVEGSWDTWSKTLASQMLSKQSPKFASSQLALTAEHRLQEYDKLTKLTNPTVRKKLLETFADETDSAAVHLRAAALPGQSTKVLLPISSMKPGEVHAPNLKNGDRVALIRYPHGGTFEIPQLTVNNRNPEARKLLGPHAKDAIGIHHSVAERLSGADFDGDTVILIPNNKGTVKSTPALDGLKGFDPHHSYAPHDGMRTIDGGVYNAKTRKTEFKNGDRPIPARKQQEMGKISNLITDMTIHGAGPEELARAVRHSMVVIDSEKHALDFKASERDNGIAQLRAKYQPKPSGKRPGGASTLLSRANAEVRVPERVLRKASQGGPVDPLTGKKVYVETGRQIQERVRKVDPTTGKVTYVSTGRTKPAQSITKRLALAEDARSLVSEPGTPMELIYAGYSNRLKALANTARKTALETPHVKRSPSAAKTHANEVDSLRAKLNAAKKNAPLERQAQALAAAQVSQRRQANPGMEEADVKKIKNQALTEARIRTGAKKHAIDITQAEWNAIQAGAVSHNMLEEVLRHADMETVKKLATPKSQPKLTATERTRAKVMADSGFTQAEIAQQLGVSQSTVSAAISEM